MKTTMKQEYMNPLCEPFSVLTESTLLTGSKFTGEGYGGSEDDDENWG